MNHSFTSSSSPDSKHLMSALRIASILLLSASLACGGASRNSATTPHADALQELREEAAANPTSVPLWTQLVEAELLGPAGDPTQARPALDHLLELQPNDARLWWMSAVEHRAHGRDEASFQAAERSLRNALTTPGSEETSYLALTALLNVYEDVARYRERAVPLLDLVLESPQNVGPRSYWMAARFAMTFARRRGDRERVDAILAAVGCGGREWRAAGSFGPYANESFDQRVPAEGEGPLAESYELGSRRGTAETVEGESERCMVSFASEELMLGGAMVAETFVDVAEAGTQTLFVSTRGAFKLSVDGEEVRVHDSRRELLPANNFVPLELSAGRHEIEIKILGGRSMSFWMNGQTRGNGALDTNTPDSLIELYSRVSYLLEHDRLAAREMWSEARDKHGEEVLLGSPMMLDTEATVATLSPFISEESRDERVRSAIATALERDPNLVQLALLNAERIQDSQEQYAAIRRLSEAHPEHIDTLFAWAGAQNSRSEVRGAEETLRRVVTLTPDACSPVGELQSILRQQGRIAESNALVERLTQCDATSTAHIELLQRQQRYEEARAAFEELAPLLEEDEVKMTRMRLARALGDEETARRIEDELTSEDGAVNARQVLSAVDRILAQGNQAQALRHLEEQMAQHPEETTRLRDLRRDLTGHDDLEPHRRNGAEIIAAYEESGAEAHAADGAVLVFDYMVTRVYDDGSTRSLVHQIYKIQSDEARERLGQLSLPGHILTLHSIKPDGQRLEPEAIAGLGSSIPMTELDIGDYVEYEYFTSRGPNGPDSFLSTGWSFDSYEQPFAFSQIRIVAPPEIELTAEARGGAPEAEVETVDGLRVYTWTMENVPQRTPEPAAVPRPDFRPTLAVGWNAGWQEYFERGRDTLNAPERIDPANRGLVDEILAGLESTDAEAKVERIHRWVMDNIEPGGGSSSAESIAGRRGNRTRVLRYLLGLADVETEWVFASTASAVEPGPLARRGIYQGLLLRLAGQNGRFIWSETRYGSPWDLPGDIRGQRGRVLDADLSEVVFPEATEETDLRTVAVEIEVNGDGGARYRGMERSIGNAAADLRERLREIPRADLERVLAEGLIPRFVPGAENVQVQVEGLEDAEGPLSILYAADSRRIGRVVGTELMVRMPQPVPLAQALASVPSRTTTQFTPAIFVDAHIRVTGPAGTPRVDGNVESNLGRARYKRSARTEDGALMIERQIRLPSNYVAADEYPAFSEWARGVSNAEGAEIIVPLR